jgi:hypothetical protein
MARPRTSTGGTRLTTTLPDGHYDKGGKYLGRKIPALSIKGPCL